MVSASTSLVRRCALVLIVWIFSAHASIPLASDLIFEDDFEVALGAAFFVSPQGFDTNPGTKALPFQTINKGIAAAGADPVNKTVVVAAGTYSENISLVDGVSLFGQYQTGTWTRNPANGFAAVGSHVRSVTALDIASPTTFDGFEIYGAINDIAGGNSYAIYVSNSSNNLRISNNVIYGGRGGAGAIGSAGSNGIAGVNGAAYSTALDSFTTVGTGTCNSTNNRVASGGGVRTCNGTPVSGGDGGGNNCTPLRSTQNSTANSPASAGHSSLGTGDGAGGTVGARGYDAQLNGTCFLPANGGGQALPMFGTEGADGGGGASAIPVVAGCAAPAGHVAFGDWMTDAASGGSAGANGGGGGGGAAGGGATCTGTSCKDMLGGHGGGGGSGGCAGVGGGGGNGGGGVFNIFIVGGTAPIIRRNTLFLGDGGDGGNGGDGGVGGLGGNGSQGGQTGALFCTGAGGQGGNGGDGGHGSGGGGGCGGGSGGIYTFGIGTPDYCTAGLNISYGGFAGSGGTGGAALVSPGGSGQIGVQAACSFN
jgi:hypothetical protein